MDQNKTSFLEIITAGFSAGEVKTFVLAGGYFELIDAPYPVTVRLVDRYGTLRGYMTQAEASFYMRQGDFDAIEITSANTQTIRFAYGSAEAGTRRTSGVVEVVDGSKNRSASGASFVWSGNVTGVTGIAPVAQLVNKSTNKAAIFKSIYASCSANAILSVFWKDADIGSVVANGLIPKIKGLSASSMESRALTNAGFTPDFPYSIINFGVTANITFGFILQDPIIIKPGTGIALTASAPASQIIISAEYHEEFYS